jgi:hypothetical protein
VKLHTVAPSPLDVPLTINSSSQGRQHPQASPIKNTTSHSQHITYKNTFGAHNPKTPRP